MSAAVVGVNKHLPMKKIMMHLWQKNRTHLKYQSYYIYVLRDVNRSSSYVLQKLLKIQSIRALMHFFVYNSFNILYQALFLLLKKFFSLDSHLHYVGYWHKSGISGSSSLGASKEGS